MCLLRSLFDQQNGAMVVDYFTDARSETSALSNCPPFQKPWPLLSPQLSTQHESECAQLEALTTQSGLVLCTKHQ